MKVDEIFGPTIQGEGALAGSVTNFVRLGGCDYRCSWCDTMHAVDPVNVPNWRDMTAEEIAAEVKELTPKLPEGSWVTISGGNPAVWANELLGLVHILQWDKWRVNIETQGSIPNRAFRSADMVTISPKGPSSGMAFDIDKLRDCLAICANPILKFVVADDEDFTFARGVANLIVGWPGIYAQPLTKNGSFNYRWLCEKVASTPGCAFWKVIPQLHVLAWGNERGR